MTSQYDAIIRGMLLLAIEALDNRDSEGSLEDCSQKADKARVDYMTAHEAHEAQMKELQSYDMRTIKQVELERAKSAAVKLVLISLIEKIKVREKHAVSTASQMSGISSWYYWKGRALTYKEILEDLEEVLDRWSREKVEEDYQEDYPWN